MTLHQRNAAPHRMLVARQGRGNGTNDDDDPITPLLPSQSSPTGQPSPPPQDPGPPGDPSPTTRPPQRPSDTTNTNTTTTNRRTTNSPPPVTSPVQSPSSTPTPPSSSSSSSSSSPSRVTRPSSTQTPTPRVPPANSSQTSYSTPSTPTEDPAAVSTISASDVPEKSSGISAGSVAGGVLGGLAALAILGFIIAFFLRRINRRNRRRRLNASLRPHSDFGTFGTDSPAAIGIEEEKFNENNENEKLPPLGNHHNVAPSISSSIAMNLAGYGSAGPSAADPQAAMTGGAVPPSEALAAAMATSAAGGQLHERPKYVFGQSTPGGGAGGAETSTDGAVGTDAAGAAEEGAYGEQQTGYDYETYANANAAAAYGGEAYGYQDATRGYQTGAYDQQQQPAQQGYYYATAGGATAYAAGAGQYYDYSQYGGQQQQGGQQGGAYGGM